jgi:hypothetical protein
MASLETQIPTTPLSARRSKPAKPIPRLPLSAFSPPNSGVGEKFPLPPSPATVHPQAVCDASVIISSIDALTAYSTALGKSLSTRLSGVVVSVPESAIGSVDQLCVHTFMVERCINDPLYSASAHQRYQSWLFPSLSRIRALLCLLETPRLYTILPSLRAPPA